MSKQCLVCGENELAIRENQMLCGFQGYEIDDFSEAYNGRHHFVMTKKLQHDIDLEKQKAQSEIDYWENNLRKGGSDD